MKAVLISIQPKWCELIASGKKTVEVRKTRPKLKEPFKCYVYCTNDKNNTFCTDNGNEYTHIGNGKVIGEFVCDKVFTIKHCLGSYRCEGLTRHENDRIASSSQLSLYDMRNYLLCNDGYAWHITNLVIYDKPKELSEFYKKCEATKCEGCEHLKYQRVNPSEYDYDCEYFNYKIPITRAPQSWCYVEEITP